MDILTFISNLVKALAWPLLAFVLSLAFKSEVRSILRRLAKIQGKGWSIEIRDEMETDKKKIAASAKSGPTGRPYDELIAISPRAAITESWREVEQAITSIFSARVTRTDHTKPLNPSVAIAYLHHEGLISAEEEDIIQKLRHWRNRAAHDNDDPDLDTATAYCDLASTVLSKLKEKGA